ncbi:MAG: UDP-N-acetylmuramoyl-L-alanine--D-glutamate ligase [Candidatus Saccharibacteria bacterium]
MKIAIAGYGLEGESNYHYWAADRGNEIVIVDQKQPERDIPGDAQTLFGEDALEKLQGFDMVVRTAGIAPRKIKTDGKIWSATNEFFDKCPAPIIGVTGSKGKGTTSSLIASILEHSGRNVWLLGNIGKPGLDVIGDIQQSDIVVYELSSFQLWDLEKSPHIGVVLFIEQEHLDVHMDMDEYVAAKANIAKYQDEGDILIYNQSNGYAKFIADSSKAQLVGYTDLSSAHVADGSFYYGEQKICSIDVLKLMGRHNQDNACAAIDAVWNFTHDTDIISNGLGDFTGLPHRLQFVRSVGDVSYYDDSIATTPSAAIAALRSFDQPKVIILGGSSKGSDFTELGKELTKHDAKAILIGVEADNIAVSCRQAGFHGFETMTDPTMDKVVTRAQKLAKPGSVVLLSPASASFGLFKNYADRGEQFQSAVNAL